MNWKKIKAITSLSVFALFVIGAGVGAVLVQQNQDTRQQASGGCEQMTQTDKVPGLYSKIESNKVVFCDPDGGEYSIFVKYNSKSQAEEEIFREVKNFPPGEEISYSHSCPPPDKNYAGDLAININTPDKEVSKGWGHVYTCPTNNILPDPNLSPITSQSPESIEITKRPEETQPTDTPQPTTTIIPTATLTPLSTPTQTLAPTALPTLKPTINPTNTTPLQTNDFSPTQAVLPTTIPLSSIVQPVPTRPNDSEFPSKTSPTPTTTKKSLCNESCTFNADCADLSHICTDTSVGKRCRLDSDPESLLCVVLEEGNQDIDPTATPYPQCRADLNKDGFVDLSDYMLIRDRFLLRDISRQTYIAQADIDQDGVVDLIDYSILVNEFFMHCQN